jgi:hypothetical protein
VARPECGTVVVGLRRLWLPGCVAQTSEQSETTSKQLSQTFAVKVRHCNLRKLVSSFHPLKILNTHTSNSGPAPVSKNRQDVDAPLVNSPVCRCPQSHQHGCCLLFFQSVQLKMVILTFFFAKKVEHGAVIFNIRNTRFNILKY